MSITEMEATSITELGYSQDVADKLVNVFSGCEDTEKMTSLLSTLKVMNETGVENALTEYETKSSTEEVSEKAQTLLECLSTHKIQPEETKSPQKKSDRPASEQDEKLNELCEKLNFDNTVSRLQRKLGPPKNYEGEIPGHDCEVYIGRMPKDVYEVELYEVIEKMVGPDVVYDIRVMMDDYGQNRGFAFVLFKNSQVMKQCADKLNGHKLRDGKPLKASPNVPNVRLYVANLPKPKTKDEIFEEFTKISDGLKEVIVYGVPDDDKIQNRGFCFLNYDSHTNAKEAKRKLDRGDILPFKRNVFVDWAETIDTVDDETMAKVKIAYVRNLSSDVTEAKIKEVFAVHGEIEQVRRKKDFAFVHFVERENCLKAIEALSGTELGKQKVEVSLARPISDDQKKKRDLRRIQNQFGIMPLRPSVPSLMRGAPGPMRASRGMYGMGLTPMYGGSARGMGGGMRVPPSGMMGGYGPPPIQPLYSPYPSSAYGHQMMMSPSYGGGYYSAGYDAWGMRSNNYSRPSTRGVRGNKRGAVGQKRNASQANGGKSKQVDDNSSAAKREKVDAPGGEEASASVEPAAAVEDVKTEATREESAFGEGEPLAQQPI